MAEPLSFTRGDTVTWTKDLADYPANQSWVLKYYFRGPQVIDITAAASGASHLVTIAAAASATYIAGRYSWQARVEKGAEKFTVDSGTITIDADMASLVGTYDGRTASKKMLDAVELMLSGKATSDVKEYEIEGRKLARYEWADLIMLRDKLRAEVAAEERTAKIEAGLGNGFRIYTRG